MKLGSGSAHTSHETVIEILFHYNVLMEYQLLHLQGSVREFVERMTSAISALDKQITEEGKQALHLFEKLFLAVNTELDFKGMEFKSNSKDQVDDLLENLQYKHDYDESREKNRVFFANLMKSIEYLARIDERVKPYVYTLVECLNFEDIQSQRLEHLIDSFKMLHHGLMELIHGGIENYSANEVRDFFVSIKEKTRSMYTMPEERAVFDQVFVVSSRLKNKSAS